MTRIDFYTDAPDKASVACRIAAKAFAQKKRVLIVTPDAQVLAQVDRMLWMNPAIGFVPHCRAHERIAGETPILLAASAESPPHDEVLVNLGDERPATFARFERVIEIVTGADDDKRLARERYKFYRDRGYELATHKLGKAA